jgi:hypothetical protein
VFSQISQYNLKVEIKAWFETSGGLNVANTHYDDLDEAQSAEEINHEQEDFMYQKAAELYFDVDGVMGRKITPFPHLSFHNPDIVNLDKTQRVRLSRAD